MTENRPEDRNAYRDAVIEAAVRIVYDGMSDAAWHRIRRAVEAMERATPARNA